VSQEQRTLPIGATVSDNNGGRYVVEALLGVGGFSAVYRVRDRRMKEQVFALKEVIHPNLEDRRTLGMEGELLMRLKQPSLPRVYQVFEDVRLKRIYLLMDNIEGKNLEILRREEPTNKFSLDVVLTVMLPIVTAVVYLHKQNPPIVHRDIKPPNIIVPRGTGNAVLVDFGLAKEYVEEKTTNILRFGTPGYAAPEQYAQGTNLRTDVYGFGATIYNLLTGIKPIDALLRIVNEEQRDPLKRADVVCPEVPTSVGRVLERAMSLRSEHRFASIEEFWKALCLASEHPENVVTKDIVVFDSATSEDKDTLPLTDFVGEEPRTAKRQSPALKKYIFLLVSLLVLLSVATMFFFWLPTRPHIPGPTIPPQRATIAIHTIVPDPCAPAMFTIPPGANYPLLTPCYGGTIDDIGVAKEATGMYLTKIKQNGGNLSGNFQGLNVAGTFSGTIQQNGDIQFKVTVIGRTDTIVFSGSNKYGGDLRGQFEVHDSNGQATLDEYGSWYAQPVRSLSALSA
jgi:serine/threonine protein kinase